MKDKSCSALLNANRIGGGDVPPCVGVKSSALPEVQASFLMENSHTGVSTRNALLVKCSVAINKEERNSKINKYAALVCNAYHLWS